VRIDARLPVRFGMLADVREGDAVLLPVGAAVPGGVPAAWLLSVPAAVPEHPAGCTCCLPRNPAAQALGDLFLRRGRGEVGAFRSVLAVVSPDQAGQVRAALAADPLVSGRYRLA